MNTDRVCVRWKSDAGQGRKGEAGLVIAGGSGDRAISVFTGVNLFLYLVEEGGRESIINADSAADYHSRLATVFAERYESGKEIRKTEGNGGARLVNGDVDTYLPRK